MNVEIFQDRQFMIRCSVFIIHYSKYITNTIKGPFYR